MSKSIEFTTSGTTPQMFDDAPDGVQYNVIDSRPVAKSAVIKIDNVLYRVKMDEYLALKSIESEYLSIVCVGTPDDLKYVGKKLSAALRKVRVYGKRIEVAHSFTIPDEYVPGGDDLPF